MEYDEQVSARLDMSLDEIIGQEQQDGSGQMKKRKAKSGLQVPLGIHSLNSVASRAHYSLVLTHGALLSIWLCCFHRFYSCAASHNTSFTVSTPTSFTD